MHILACIKQTPATDNVRIDPDTGNLAREGAAAAINPFDEYAIEEAVRLKERAGGDSSVSVLTMGPPQAEQALRDALARGADRAFHLCGREFSGADTWATSYALFKAVEKVSAEAGPVDLVVCGRQTNDGDTGHVGPSLGAWLDRPHAAYVRKVESVGPRTIVVERMMEDGADILELELPAVISVVKEINEPRPATLKGKMAARRAAVARWDAAALGADPAWLGIKGSPTVVSRTFRLPVRLGGVLVGGATAEEKAQRLVELLLERGLP